MEIDIETKIIREENIEYVKCPLFNCTIIGCEFAAHKSEKLMSHINQTHKEAYRSILSLPNIYIKFYGSCSATTNN